MSDLCSAETPVVQLNQVTTSQKQPLDAVMDPGKGPGPLPHIFSPSWGSKGWKKFIWDRHHPILSQGLDDRAPSAIQQGKGRRPSSAAKIFHKLAQVLVTYRSSRLYLFCASLCSSPHHFFLVDELFTRHFRCTSHNCSHLFFSL